MNKNKILMEQLETMIRKAERSLASAKRQIEEGDYDLLENENSKKDWQIKREKMLKDKIDVTKFMIDFIENYPESFQEYPNQKILQNGKV